MPDNWVFLLFFRHGWAVFIAVSFLNALIWWRRAQPVIAAHPERREGYRRLIAGFLFWGNLPWIVMGVGIEAGGVPTILHFFNPRNGPFAIAWYCTIALLWILNLVWLFFLRGAETLVEHPGIFNFPTSNPRMIKILFLISTLGGAVAMIMMFLGDFPTPAA